VKNTPLQQTFFAVSLAAVFGLTAGCVTKAPTRSGFIDAAQPMVRSKGVMRAQVDVRSDPARLTQIRSVRIEPAKVADGVILPSGISSADIALVLGEIDRQMCFKLSRYFDVEPSSPPSAAKPLIAASTVRVALTGLQQTNPVASVASAIVSRVVPGPGSIRLPLGLGGLNVEAAVDLPNGGGEAAAMAWSRGASVAFDKGSLSAVGDAHRFASDFAESFTALLVGPDADKRDVPKSDPCSQYGSRLNLGNRALGIGLGLHLTNPAAAETSDVNAPAAKDHAAPLGQPASR